MGDLGHPYNAKRRIIETLCQIIVSNGRDLLSLLFFFCCRFSSFFLVFVSFVGLEIIDGHKQYCVWGQEKFRQR